MKKIRLIAVALALTSASCLGGGADERTILVDFSHDEFASAMFDNFPGEVSVPQGATVVFKQIWTGEPHTVTAGTLVDEMMDTAAPWDRFFAAVGRIEGSGVDVPSPEDPPDVPLSDFLDAAGKAPDGLGDEFLEAYEGLVDLDVGFPPVAEADEARFPDVVELVETESEKIFEEASIPWAIDETEDGEGFVTQNAGQPCYLDEGGPPKDADKACSQDDQEQPVFDGRSSYYNSGIIPYEGTQGNTYKVELADDIEPGGYWFYCAVHGPGQATQLKVVEAGTEVPSQEAVNRRARAEIADFAKPMLSAFRDARDGEIEMGPETLEGPFAGVNAPVHGTINEFVPKAIETEVGEEVTWKLMGADHTISFGVPEYFPVIRFAEDGKVSLNRKMGPPAGGSPPIPESDDGEILRVDGGTYDGNGFFSSGLFGGMPYAEYTLRFSEPGTYKYACLLHPPMVGTVEVT